MCREKRSEPWLSFFLSFLPSSFLSFFLKKLARILGKEFHKHSAMEFFFARLKGGEEEGGDFPDKRIHRIYFIYIQRTVDYLMEDIATFGMNNLFINHKQGINII